MHSISVFYDLPMVRIHIKIIEVEELTIVDFITHPLQCLQSIINGLREWVFRRKTIFKADDDDVCLERNTSV